MQDPGSPFCTIDQAIADIRAGKMVIVVDSPDRENEGDLCMAAEFVTPDAINFMATHGRGLICLTLTPDRCDELGLHMMVQQNQTPYETAFTVSIEAREGIETGISAADRAHTIKIASDPASGPREIIKPGHVFPLRARAGGVLERTGQTEASVDLARLAGCVPAGVICEVMKADGTMARVPDLAVFCAEHGIKLCSVSDLIEYRRRNEKLVERGATTTLPTEHGEFTAIGYRSITDGKQHLALIKGPDPCRPAAGPRRDWVFFSPPGFASIRSSIRWCSWRKGPRLSRFSSTSSHRPVPNRSAWRLCRPPG